MTLTSDFPCSQTGCKQGADISCGACPWGPAMMEVRPPSEAPLESLSPTILPEALSAFHDSHRLTFVKYARSRGVQSDEAEDVVSAVFLTLYRVGQTFLAAESCDAFAFKVLRDAIKDHFRRRDRMLRTQILPRGSADFPGADTGGGIDSVICQVDVERGLKALPARQSDCLRMYLFLELSREQIAEYLGITPSTVSSHLSTGRHALAKQLETYQPEAASGRGGRG
ncbi:RNA polymerase sigma factor [Streptomyces erythrochromogenes]|uniref:RNA polymerase sigma factor n=1 Tax=Streptomyces erythrochromogenes TaxID=285574 RepID=UPI00367B25A2